MTEWKPIPGHDGYEASDQGEIRSIDHVVRRKNGIPHTVKGRILRSNNKNRPQVNIRGERILVQKLVILTFHGPKPFAGAEVRHLDDDRYNNKATNLAWGTRGENIRDAWRNGRIPIRNNRGSSNRSSKLTEKAVIDILTNYTGERGDQTRFARKYKVSQTLIWQLVNRKIWTHISIDM